VRAAVLGGAVALTTLSVTLPIVLHGTWLAVNQFQVGTTINNSYGAPQVLSWLVRGDIFEEFCVLYLKTMGYEVWLLDDLPVEIRELLQLPKQDMGIDIIVKHEGVFYAVQCKYKKPDQHKKQCVTWKALSTFYALCLRTGPFQKYIVMTNCDYVRHQGKKTSKDVSICLGTFRKLTGDNWLLMVQANSVSVDSNIPSGFCLSKEELRQKRIQYFSSAPVDKKLNAIDFV
jgi:hypothetical protein